MKKILFPLIIVVAAFFSCKSKTTKPTEGTTTTKQAAEYKYKVLGLNDTIISDSVWKMIFKVPGINQLYTNKDDSTLIVKVDSGGLNSDEIVKEIEKRGATVIKVIQ